MLPPTTFFGCLRWRSRGGDVNGMRPTVIGQGAEIAPNQSIAPTGGSRFCQPAFVSQWRLPPVAHAQRWAEQ